MQRAVLTFLDSFPGSSSATIAQALAHTEAAALSCIGYLIDGRYIERDGLGGYLSTGMWSPGSDGLEADVDLPTPAAITNRTTALRALEALYEADGVQPQLDRDDTRTDEVTQLERLIQETQERGTPDADEAGREEVPTRAQGHHG